MRALLRGLAARIAPMGGSPRTRGIRSRRAAGRLGVAGALTVAAGLAVAVGLAAAVAGRAGAVGLAPAAGGDRGDPAAAMPPGAERPGAPEAPEPRGALATAQGIENVPYDGRFTLARIRFGASLGGGGFGFGRTPPWAHDYPRAERNLMRIVSEVSYLRPSVEGGNVFDLDDPELMRFPVAYLVEPGYWRPEEEHVERLREYLLKGGFLIVDDFRGRDWLNFEAQMRRVLPDHDLVEVDVTEPIFHTYLSMESLDFRHPYDAWADPTYFAIYEDNDPTRRIMVIVNYDQDIGDYWEYADLGRYPVDPSNEAFKLGLNYLIYGMTH
jgi:hypothetical protein